jgi:hypothetical protein
LSAYDWDFSPSTAENRSGSGLPITPPLFSGLPRNLAAFFRRELERPGLAALQPSEPSQCLSMGVLLGLVRRDLWIRLCRRMFTRRLIDNRGGKLVDIAGFLLA